MAKNRQNIEYKIFNILTYIENKTLAFPLKQNISLFSLKELKQLLEFLETWNLKPIYILIESKYKEHLWLLEEFKTIKIQKKVNKKQKEEKNEKEIEEKELNELINF